MTYPDRDGAWRPPSARRPEDETPQPPGPPAPPSGAGQPYGGPPSPGTQYPGTPYSGTQYSGTQYSGTQYSGQQQPGQQYSGQQQPGQQPGQQQPGQVYPGQVYRAQQPGQQRLGQQPGGGGGYPPGAIAPSQAAQQAAAYQAAQQAAAQQAAAQQAAAGPQGLAAPQGAAVPQGLAAPQGAGGPQLPAPLPPPPTVARRAVVDGAQPVVGRTAVPAEAAPAEADAQTGASARRLAAPAVTAAPLATAAALAAAESLADGPQNGGPPASGAALAAAEARTGPSGRMSRLHIGWHSISRTALSKVAVAPAASAGLIIGRDRQHTAVPLRLFAPEPVRVTLVGGVWVAQLLIFRAFSLGARVTVVTNEPRAWAGFGERATGQYNRLTVLSSDQGLVGAGTAQRPMLTLYDLGTTGPATAPPLGPWRTQLTMLRQLDRAGVPAVQDAQYTLLQRLGSAEATLAASALRLRPHSSQFLQFMADDMIALIEGGTDRYVFLAQTGVEQQQVGAARR
jgi:hypothetical protein